MVEGTGIRPAYIAIKLYFVSLLNYWAYGQFVLICFFTEEGEECSGPILGRYWAFISSPVLVN